MSEEAKRTIGEFRDWYLNIKPEGQSSNNFKDVSGNLIAAADGLVGLMKKLNDLKEPLSDLFKAKQESLPRRLKKQLEAMQQYRELIENYPEYKEGELNNHNGYFPDIPSGGEKRGHADYVNDSAKRLGISEQ